MIGCIIQARFDSCKLPGKVLLKIDEKNTVLDFLIKQVSASKQIEKIVVATTDLPEDDLICDNLDNKKINFYRGSPKDVLDRFYKSAKKFNINTIIRILGNNPLTDPEIIDQVIKKFKNENCDYATNFLFPTYPFGTEVEVFSFDVLEKIWNKSENESDTDDITSLIMNKNEFKITNISNSKNLSHLNYSINSNENLIFIKKIIKKIQNRPIHIKDIM